MPRFYHDLGDADLAALRQRVAQKHISFIPTLLRFEVVRFVKKHRIDLFDIDKILDVDGLCRLQIDPLKVFVLEHDEFPLLVFVTLDDFVPRYFLAVGFRDAFVIDRAKILGSQ